MRRSGAVVSQGVLVAIGISQAGYREVLGAWIAESESEASWGSVFSELKQRGLRGVRYVVSDDHAGMVKAIERHFQGAVWQRCQVHFVRNALSLCGRQQRPQVLRLMKAVTESATREAAQAALAAAIAELESKAPGWLVCWSKTANRFWVFTRCRRRIENECARPTCWSGRTRS
jgi:transposase-like protein